MSITVFSNIFSKLYGGGGGLQPTWTRHDTTQFVVHSKAQLFVCARHTVLQVSVSVVTGSRHDMTCLCVCEPCNLLVGAVLWCPDECWDISTNLGLRSRNMHRCWPPTRAFMDDLYVVHIRFLKKKNQATFPHCKIINHYGLFYTCSKLHLSWEFNTGV